MEGVQPVKTLFAFLILASAAFAELIPAARLVDWTPGTHTGVPGGIPTTRTQYVNAVTEGVDNTGATDVTAAINALLAACPANQYVYLPAGTYRCDGTLEIGVSADDHNITLRGDGVTTIIDSRSNVMGVQVGASGGFVTPAGATTADMTVNAASATLTNGGLFKGSTQLEIGSTATISEGQIVRLYVRNDPSIPIISTFADENLVQQVFLVESKTATTITFSPPLHSDYGVGTLTARLTAPLRQVNGVGVEDLLIDLQNSTAAYGGIRFNQANACWAKGVRVNEANNYPASIIDSFKVELRRSYMAPNRNLLNTSGAGILHNSSHSTLIEDNEIVNNFPGIEVNAGSSGMLVSRNFFFGSYINTNHGAWNQYNLYEGNVASGVQADGYFGGAGPDIVYNNKIGYLSLKRMTRDYSVIGNMINREPADFTVKAGTPNMSNDGSTGTANYPTTPWADYGMTGTINSVTVGTGTGYLVNSPGGYSVGATSIAVDTGTGTILAGDVVQFSGSSLRYWVTANLSAGVLTIGLCSNGALGLQASIADNATVSVSSDNLTLELAPGYSVPSYGGFDYQYLRLHWDDYAIYQQFRVVTFADGIVTLTTNLIGGGPNVYALPPIGDATVFQIGTSYTGFQELDQVVLSSTALKGNRWSDASFDSLGGDTLPNSLAYTTEPQWLLDARAEFPAATFNLRAFDPVTPATASDSDIPAGYRYTFLTPPEHTSASINALGTELSIGLNKPVVVGSGGSASATISGGLICPFDRIEGSALIFITPRTISEGESIEVTLTNPANGYEDANGNDLPSFTAYTVTNSSSSTSGVNHYGPDVAITTTDSVNSDSGTTLLQPCLVEVHGTATAVRFYIAGNTGNAAVRVTITDSAGNVLGSGTGTVTGVDRWQSVAPTSFPVTADTIYMATVQFLSNGDPTLRSLPGQAANSSYYHEATPYGTALPAQFTPITGSTSKWAIQIRVVPDAVPTVATASTANIGTLNLAP